MPLARPVESVQMLRSVPDYRSTALSVIRSRSFRRGSFKLASGQISDFYLDMKPSMFHPDGVWAISHLLFDVLKRSGVQAVGGLEMGAVPLIATVTMLSREMGYPLPGFFVRKSVKDHGTKKLLEGVVDNSEIAGKAVAIVDDVTTTGQSAMIAVDAATKAGADVRLVLSVVDRQEGAARFYTNKGIPFERIFSRDDFMGLSALDARPDELKDLIR